LNILWYVFSNVTMCDEPQSMESSLGKETKVEMVGKSKRTETQQLILVLDSYLDSKESDNQHCKYNKDTWDKLVLQVFDMKQVEVSVTTAVIILQWISKHSQELSREVKFSWHEWLMGFAFKQYSQEGSSMFLRGSNELNEMQKILLAHAVSPEKDALRALSWQTIPVIFHNMGWKTSSDSSINSPICLWSRLASAEWAIILGQGGNLSADDQATLDGCGQTLISVVQFLVSFDSKPDLPLDAAGLFHIKESLGDAFSIACEYLVQHSLQGSEPIVARVFCQILEEEGLAAFQSVDIANAALKSLIGSSTESQVEIDEPLMKLLAHVQSVTDSNDRVGSLVRPIKICTGQF
jgi:hypothetical protein